MSPLSGSQESLNNQLKHIMIWTTITDKDIDNYLMPLQNSALRQHLDPLENIINDTIARVQAEMLTNPGNPIPPNPALIPSQLKTASCHLVIEALQSRIPNLKLTDDQIRNANNARILLHRTALGQISINGTKPKPLTIEVVSSRKRQATFNNLHGL